MYTLHPPLRTPHIKNLGQAFGAGQAKNLPEPSKGPLVWTHTQSLIHAPLGPASPAATSAAATSGSATASSSTHVAVVFAIVDVHAQHRCHLLVVDLVMDAEVDLLEHAIDRLEEAG